jgi:nitroreductase
MNFIDLVNTRSSVRTYSNKPVSRILIDQCLEAARLAPSACNSQPWSFIILDTPECKTKVSDAAFSGMYSMCSFAKEAPVLIVVVTEYSSYAATLGRFIQKTQYNLIDIGIACEHLVLQATELGLGTCWIGWFNTKKVKEKLGLSKRTHINTLISLGYPAHNGIPEKKRKPIEEMRKYYS